MSIRRRNSPKGFATPLFAVALLSLLSFSLAAPAPAVTPNAPTVGIRSFVTMTEGDDGTTNAVFEVFVHFSNLVRDGVRVTYSTDDGGLNPPARGSGDGVGTCGSGVDYITTSGELTIPAGESSRMINVPVCGDRSNETTEEFEVLLSSASGAQLEPGQTVGVGVINDNDPLPRLSITRGISRLEGDAGVARHGLVALLTDPRDGQLVETGRGVTFTARTFNGTAADTSRNATGGAACGTADMDYEAHNRTTHTIAADSRRTFVFVRLCGDTTAEKSELFTVLIENVQNAELDDGVSVVTIVNDDGPSLTINDASAVEGNAMTFAVTLTGATSEEVRVDFATANRTAAADFFLDPGCVRFPGIPTGNDYIRRSGALTFPVSSQTSQTRTVVVGACSDDVFEGTETFRVNLSRPDFARITDDQGIGTIFDEDTCLDVEAGCTGVATLSPAATTIGVNERLTYDVTWTVPEGRVWRVLNTIDVRIGDEHGIAIWVRWEEASNAFCLVSGDGTCGSLRQPGGPGMLVNGPLARLHLRETTVQGSGPAGRSVTLRPSLSFKKHAEGRTFRVEATATDDRGRRDVFTQIGTLTVTDKG